MKGIILSLFIFSLISQVSLVFGQGEPMRTESGTHIYWQADRKLTQKDFQGEADSADIKYCEDKGYCAVACLGIFVEVDIPGNYRKNKPEKVYFAPAFQKSCSYLVNNTSDIRDAQILFDMAELASRIGRKLLRDYHDYLAVTADSMNFYVIKEDPDTILITGTGTSYAWHARDSAWNFYQDMSTRYLHNVYFSTENEDYEDWRIFVDDLLEQYKIYATQPDECYRMIKKQPIVKKYKRAYK